MEGNNYRDDYDIRDQAMTTAFVSAVLLSSGIGKASIPEQRKAAIRDARALVKESFEICRSEKAAAEQQPVQVNKS